MKIYKSFDDLVSAPKEIYDYFMAMESSQVPLTSTEFVESYGGNVYVIETLVDLHEIKGNEESESSVNEWASILEKPSEFDICRYTRSGKFVEIYCTTTDAGGPSFFIPREVADRCPNVTESIKLSNESWGTIPIPKE